MVVRVVGVGEKGMDTREGMLGAQLGWIGAFVAFCSSGVDPCFRGWFCRVMPQK